MCFRLTFSEQDDKPSYTPIASATLEVVALKIPSVNISFMLNYPKKDLLKRFVNLFECFIKGNKS